MFYIDRDNTLRVFERYQKRSPNAEERDIIDAYWAIEAQGRVVPLHFKDLVELFEGGSALAEAAIEFLAKRYPQAQAYLVSLSDNKDRRMRNKAAIWAQQAPEPLGLKVATKLIVDKSVAVRRSAAIYFCRQLVRGAFRDREFVHAQIERETDSIVIEELKLGLANFDKGHIEIE